MVGKKSGKALLREEGLARTDNGMKQTSWPDIPMINQKNYYTDFMKREDQILPFRLQQEANTDKMIRNAKDKDRALARTGNTDVPVPIHTENDQEDEDGAIDGIDSSKIIVIHPGSQNLRIGFASDPLPQTIPMALAVKCHGAAKEYKPVPKRAEDVSPEQMFGEEFSKKFVKMSKDLKERMKEIKLKALPNSKDLAIGYNKKSRPEIIKDHNDPIRVEWTDVKTLEDSSASCFTGMEALRIPENSNPNFRLYYPIQQGWLHEKDYLSREHLVDDLETVFECALKKELGLELMSSWEQYHCVMVIPDLYDKVYVQYLLDWCLTTAEFKQVCFIQESLAATFGAGYSTACIVDVGAQKTSICCVEDGMCIEDSRINLKYGGNDVTHTFIKMMLHDHFPYADINLARRHDFLLAEELKMNFCTLNLQDVAPQAHEFHLRAPGQETRKYGFKTFDEIVLAPMGFVDPSIFDNSEKLKGRHTLIDRSYNAYDTDIPDDPTSKAQLEILTAIKPSLATTATGYSMNGNGTNEFATPSKEKANPLSFLSKVESEANGFSRVTSAAASPAPEGSSTPAPFVFGANGTNVGSPERNASTPNPPAGMFIDQNQRTQKDLAIERDTILPIAPLDTAIMTSITNAVKAGEDKKVKDFFGGIMLIGGGAKTPGFGPFLEKRLRAKRPDIGEKILVGVSPREMDGQVVIWKGASIFGRFKSHESWIGPLEYERHGHRAIHNKVLWQW
ncbi:hypothetical protein HYFRA_00002826 [Hymenoscyphus fraxineus]|uniref:Actin-related protein 8 n=1 Tax=Hymenoscyphus fraxineus TaxID=746836 RepID=A0A9N9PQM3_9HELO|nr:hypothetical protein HYFRA_00002826 [Hymenoscyphus fraxineus]